MATGDRPLRESEVDADGLLLIEAVGLGVAAIVLVGVADGL
jgi:hypothetical protein